MDSNEPDTPTESVDADQSPKSMAAAAYNAAVALRDRSKRIDGGADNDDGDALPRPTKLFKSSREGERGESAETENLTGNRIEEIWRSGHADAEYNLEETVRLLIGEIDSMVQCGLGAFHDFDAVSRQLIQTKELAETRTREVDRFNSVDEQSRASLSKLLRAVESSKSDARDSSRAAQIETSLRKENNKLRDERDKAVLELSDTRRKQALHEEELRLTKSKLNRVVQEKHGMERDSRAAISLARSLDNNNSNDVIYYRGKVGELSDQLQAAQRKILELADKLQVERSAGKSKSGMLDSSSR